MHGRPQRRSANLPTVTPALKAAANSKFCGQITQWSAVLRQNSMRTENSALPCRDRLSHPGYSFTPRAPRISPGRTPARCTCIYKGWGNSDVFATPLVRIRQPDHTGGVTLPVAHEKGRDLRLCCDFFGLAFPSPVRDACGPRASSEYTARAGVSGGVRQLR